MMNNKNLIRWIVFIITAVGTIAGLFFIQNRYLNVEKDGAIINWPVAVEKTVKFVPSDYLSVKYLGAKAKWKDKTIPKVGEDVYVSLALQQNNNLVFIKDASRNVPVKGLYIDAKVKSYKDGNVEFTIPYDRVQLDIDKINPSFYNSDYKGLLLAEMKLKDGVAVIADVKADGESITVAEPKKDAKAVDIDKLLKVDLKKIVKDKKDSFKPSI